MREGLPPRAPRSPAVATAAPRLETSLNREWRAGGLEGWRVEGRGRNVSLATGAWGLGSAAWGQEVARDFTPSYVSQMFVSEQYPRERQRGTRTE